MLADVPLVALEVGGGQAPELPDAPGQAPEVAAQLTGAAAQAPAVAALLRHTGFQSIEVLRDLAGHERVVVGRR
jgi:methylase of polypeptide subunit release factors